MWIPIFAQNRQNVLETLEEFISNLNEFKDKLQAEEFDALLADMKNINTIKSILDRK